MEQSVGRGEFISQSLCLYFQLSDSDTKSICSNSSVCSFLNDPDVKILYVTPSNHNKLLFWTEVYLLTVCFFILKVPELIQQKRAVAFIKRFPEQITDENINSLILTISVHGPASQTLYNLLDNLFAPWLLKV